MKKYSLAFTIVLLYCNVLYAWDDKITHPEITEYALINKSNIVNFLTSELGFTEEELGDDSKNIIELFMDGAEREDLAYRGFNHFHEPISNEKLHDWVLLPFPWYWKGKWSNPDWALGGTSVDCSNCISCTPDEDSNACNDFSWTKAREAFYEALIADNVQDRNEMYARTFRSLGQILHLLEDMSVPAHTRNDLRGHAKIQTLLAWPKYMLGNNLEYYAKKHPSFTSLKMSGATVPSFETHRDFWDTDKYDGNNLSLSLNNGLAEYSSANFVSTNSMFDEYPHPSLDDTNYNFSDILLNFEQVDAEDGQIDNRLYLKNVSGDNINHLASIAYLTSHLMEDGHEPYFILDEKCHMEYIEKLIPKAVGYSAGVINYFFRGKLEISEVKLTDGGVGGVTSVSVKVKNVTTNNDEMGPGNLIAVVSYKMSETDENFSYKFPNNSPPVSSLINTEPEEFVFDFSSDPIPSDAAEIYIHVVFQGTLGKEQDDAIAVGMIELKFEYALIKMSYDGETKAVVWDILMNRMANIENGGITVSFPCDYSELTEWLSGKITANNYLYNTTNVDLESYPHDDCAIGTILGCGEFCRVSYSRSSSVVDSDGFPLIDTTSRSREMSCYGIPDGTGSYHAIVENSESYFTNSMYSFISSWDKLIANTSGIETSFRVSMSSSYLYLQDRSLFVYETDESLIKNYSVITPFGELSAFSKSDVSHGIDNKHTGISDEHTHNWTEVASTRDFRVGFYTDVSSLQIYSYQYRLEEGHITYCEPLYDTEVLCHTTSNYLNPSSFNVHAQASFDTNTINADPVSYGRNSGLEIAITSLYDSLVPGDTAPEDGDLPDYSLSGGIYR